MTHQASLGHALPVGRLLAVKGSMPTGVMPARSIASWTMRRRPTLSTCVLEMKAVYRDSFVTVDSVLGGSGVPEPQAGPEWALN